ncbi:MAG: hypothetical protein ABI811_02115 [Acidobacteriota bacterium]
MKQLAILCLAASLAFAQDAQQKGKRLIDEAIAALGGEKFLNVQNRVELGRAYSFFQQNLSGLSVAHFYTQYVPVDASKTATALAQQEHQAFSKDEEFFNVFREEGGWEVTYRGPKPLEKDQIVRHHDSLMHNIFYILRNRLKEPGMIFEAKAGQVLDNVPVNVVDVIDSTNRVVTVYLHQTTKLPVQQAWTWRDPQTRERNDEVTRFSRYRDVDGTQWPYQTHRERNGLKIYEMFADTVLINQDLDERRFLVPGPDTRPLKNTWKDVKLGKK